MFKKNKSKLTTNLQLIGILILAVLVFAMIATSTSIQTSRTTTPPTPTISSPPTPVVTSSFVTTEAAVTCQSIPKDYYQVPSEGAIGEQGTPPHVSKLSLRYDPDANEIIAKDPNGIGITVTYPLDGKEGLQIQGIPFYEEGAMTLTTSKFIICNKKMFISMPMLTPSP